jgi:hypothetical protein
MQPGSRKRGMETQFEWDQLVDALRDELQEKGGVIRLLNQQTEVLYRGDASAVAQVGEQIRGQLCLATRCTRARELTLRQTALNMKLSEDIDRSQILGRFPEYVQPLLEALFGEVDRLSGRMEERLKQNQQLKDRFLTEAESTV